jgi:[acyl-carrier-protein] S-malonyltransferase
MSQVFLFPGQGAQKAGMGRELAERYPSVARVFQEADEILGFGLSKLCFEGPDEALAQTEVTQPALFTTSVAILTALQEQGIAASAAAGHSVGEYAALVAAGSIDFENALPVVRKRGELMAAAVADTPGAMAAIIGLTADDVEAICHEASALGVCEPSNLNAPTQIVISGQAEAIEQAMELAKERGAKAIRLNVSAPFHCSMMRPVADQLLPAVESLPVREPRIPVIANAVAGPVTTAKEVRDALIRQIESPVRWVETMQWFLSHGFDSFLEVGPGRVLAGLARSIDREASVTGVASPDDIGKLVSQ